MEKYKVIANAVRKKIIEGEYLPDQKLPSEKEMGEIFQASKLTIKKAIDILVSEGLIVKRRGSGTFVKSLSIEEMERLIVDNQMRGTSAFHPDKEVTSKILQYEIVPATEKVASKLNIPMDTQVYEIYRVRLVNKQPTVIEKTFMPVSIIPGLRKTDLEGSIYTYIEDKLGLYIESGHRTISVRKANDIEVEELQLETGDPVGVAEQIGFLSNGAPFEYSISVHRYDQFSVEMMVKH